MADQVPVDSRVLPHDLGAEAAALSAEMVDASKLAEVVDLLDRPDYFYSSAHALIHGAILALDADGKPHDIVHVATWLKDHDRLAQVGGMPYLTEVLNAAPTVTHKNVRGYAQTVHDKWLARQAIVTCQKYVAQGYAGYAGYHADAAGFVGAATQELMDLASGVRRGEAVEIRDQLRVNFQALAKTAEAGRLISGISTGFESYDRMTAGLHDAELTIVAARPGMGKTTFVLNVAANVAALPPEKDPAGGNDDLLNAVAVFSLEMSKEQLVDRMICSEGKVDLTRMRAPRTLTPTDWKKINDASTRLGALPLWIDDTPAISLVALRAKVRRIKARARTARQRLRLIAIDYLQLMSGTGDENNREQEVSGLSRGLKQLAKDEGLPVICLSQLSRECEKRARDKRPQLADLRESGAIEQDADNVVFIYRDDYYAKLEGRQTEVPNIAELIIAKQRSGPTDTVRVRFDAKYTRFDNLADGEWEEADRGY